MSDETMLELQRMLHTSQDKYNYFILAAVGAAIALAINQTKGSSISYSQIPLAGAVLCWGLSFYFGCRRLRYVSSILYKSIELLRIQSGEHEQFPPHPQVIATMQQIIQEDSDCGGRAFKMQFSFLVAGGLMYIVWHILEMWLRT